jgi:hypothetical protein
MDSILHAKYSNIFPIKFGISWMAGMRKYNSKCYIQAEALKDVTI